MEKPIIFIKAKNNSNYYTVSKSFEFVKFDIRDLEIDALDNEYYKFNFSKHELYSFLFVNKKSVDIENIRGIYSDFSTNDKSLNKRVHIPLIKEHSIINLNIGLEDKHNLKMVESIVGKERMDVILLSIEIQS